MFKKFIAIIVYTLIILFIGRNLAFLPKINPFADENSEMEALRADVKKVTDAEPGNYGVYYASLDDNSHFGINEKEVFTAASVNKIPVVATAYYLAGKGKLNLEDIVTLQKEDIQDYGTGSLRYQDRGTTYSIKTLIQLALRQSDNTAAYIIVRKIGMDNVQKTINSWGLTQTDMTGNKTSPYDMYLIFKKIYKGEVTTSALTKEFLSFLTDSDFEDRLPSLLPENTVVYHKTGDGIGYIHDIGIIKYNKKAFYLGVMTSDIGDNETNTKRYIGIIAKKVFDFTLND